MPAPSPLISAKDLVTFEISIGGSTINTAYQVHHVSISKELNKISSAKISIYDGNPSKQTFEISETDTFVPGNEIEIKAGYNSENESIFKGIITKQSIKFGNGRPRLEVECRDKAIKLTGARKNAYFPQSKDSDALEKIIKAQSLEASVEATQVEHEELVQYYCTDWDFVVSRAEANGFVVDVDAGKVTIGPPKVSEEAVLSVTYGVDLFEFHSEMDSRTQYAAVEGMSWDMSTQAIIKAEGKTPTVNDQSNVTSSELSKVLGIDKVILRTEGQMDQNGLQAWADAEMQKSWLSKIRGFAKFQGSAKARPGAVLTLNGVGKRYNGSIYLGGVNHEISAGQWFTEGIIGISSEWFTELPDIEAPENSGLLPGIQGLHIGKVKQIQDDPNGETRILVKIPIMEDDNNGVWARISNFYATNTAGSFFMPEVDSEVILAFVNNDPRFPIILGSLYSKPTVPPFTPDEDNTMKGIVTKSQCKLTFDDTKKVINVSTPGGNVITLDDENQLITLVDQNSNQIKMSSEGINIESSAGVIIKAAKDIELNASGNIKMTASDDVKISGADISSDATGKFSAQGESGAQLSSSGDTVVKGTMVKIN